MYILLQYLKPLQIYTHIFYLFQKEQRKVNAKAVKVLAYHGNKNKKNKNRFNGFETVTGGGINTVLETVNLILCIYYDSI